MTAEETNEYLDIYENYVEDLIRLDGAMCVQQELFKTSLIIMSLVVCGLDVGRVLKNAVCGLECLV